jgi:hypothetical protein
MITSSINQDILLLLDIYDYVDMVRLHQMNVYAYNCKDMIINIMTIQWSIDSVFQDDK